MSERRPMSENDRARQLYEQENAKLRRHTAAAWVKWEDADPDVRAMWINEVRRRAT